MARRTTPTLQAAWRRSEDATTGTETVVRVTCLVVGRPSCTQVRRTSLPGGPLTSDTASSCLRPPSDRPSARVMTSPTSIPARLAGESSYTTSTRSPRGCWLTCTPTPENWLFCDCLKRR